MTEIHIDTTEILSVMQEMFPREYTICVQKVHISKLEALISNKETAVVGEEQNETSSEP